MKKLVFLFLSTIALSCQTRQDKLLKELDKEELKESLMTSEIIAKRDSAMKNSELENDAGFKQRMFEIQFDDESQKKYIEKLKERILLEK